MNFFQGKPRNQWELYCLDAHVDADNEVRLIDLFVDSLNLSEHGFKVEFEENGRAAYHPGALLRLFIYGYLNPIGSSRQHEKLKARPFFGIFIGSLRHSGFLGW
jgi:transposase